MQSKLKDSLFFIAFVCGHKDTTIFAVSYTHLTLPTN